MPEILLWGRLSACLFTGSCQAGKPVPRLVANDLCAGRLRAGRDAGPYRFACAKRVQETGTVFKNCKSKSQAPGVRDGAFFKAARAPVITRPSLPSS